MPISADCHLHSHHSGDSETPMEQQIEAAICAGLTAMCFTEHFDKDFPYAANPEISPADYSYFDLDILSYQKEFEEMKARFGSRIDLRFGVELGLQPHLNSFYRDFLAANPRLDFVIGSTHLANPQGQDPYYPRFYEGRSDTEAYREYFTYALSCLQQCDCFDSYGHLDYVVRYGKNKDGDYHYKDFADLIDPMLQILIEKGKALEVNTAPLSKGCKDLNPCRDILKRYREMGGEMITVGSDAHTPDRIALDFDRAESALRECGFEYYVTFVGRKPEWHKF